MKRTHDAASAEGRLALEDELGYLVCGINGCILPNQHTGDCIFPFTASRRSASAASASEPAAEPAEPAAEISIPELIERAADARPGEVVWAALRGSPW